MKKFKVITFLIFILFSLNNASATISKKSAEKIRFWTMVLASLDHFIPNNYKNAVLPAERTFIPFDDFKFKLYNPNLELEIPKKLEFLQFDPSKDSHLKIDPVLLLSNVFASSLGQTTFDENILIFIANFLIRIDTLDKGINNKIGILKIEPEVFLAEKLSEFFVIKTLDTTIKNQKILKRFAKIILLTAISSGGAYLRSVLAKQLGQEDLEKNLPKTQTVIINKLAENFFIEFFAELLQRYVIENFEKQQLDAKKKKFQQKLEEIIATTENKNSKETTATNFTPLSI